MAHGSVLAYMVQPARNSRPKACEARRIRLVSAWPVQSWPVTTLFSASSRIAPALSTSSAPKGWLPCSRERPATAMAARNSSRSFASIVFPVSALLLALKRLGQRRGLGDGLPRRQHQRHDGEHIRQHPRDIGGQRNAERLYP